MIKARTTRTARQILKNIKDFFIKIDWTRAFRIILIAFLILNIIGSIVLNMTLLVGFAGDYIRGKKPDLCPADGIAKAAESVVLVKGDKGSGSGFWIKHNILVTNNHVVVDTSNLIVTNTDGQFKAKVIETDTMKDLALLEIDDNYDYSIPLAWRAGDTNLAEDTYAVGYPGGKNIVVTKGILSALTHDDYDSRVYIQTDSAINPGNSGGPLLDKCGKVLGVNTSTVYGMQNIGFSLKYDQASKSIDDMLLASAKSSNEEKKNNYPSEQAEVVAKYYNTLSLGKIDEAYSFYSKNRQTRLPVESWKSQMVKSGFITLKTVENTDKTNTVKVDFLATDYIDWFSFQTKEYAGIWTLVRENNMWKIDESNIADLGLKQLAN